MAAERLPAFESPATLKAARTMLTFAPVEPKNTRGCKQIGIRVHVRDHKGRDVPLSQRSIELHYGDFVVSESAKGAGEARRWAMEVSYGQQPRPVAVAGREGRAYDLGEEVPPDDPDGRMPSVVTWHEGEMFFLIASGVLESDELLRIAASMY